MFGCHGIWFSHDGNTRVVSAMGKPLTLFSLPEFLERMASQGYQVEFIQKSHSRYANEYEFFETWIVYHKFTPDETRTFREWLSRLQAIVPDGADLYAGFDLAPLRQRAESGFAGLDGVKRTLDFTSPQALRQLDEWRRSMEAS